MKTLSFCQKILIVILAWLIVPWVLETVRGERPSPLYSLLHSDKGYAKNIEVKTYILNDTQTREVLINPHAPIKPILPGRQEENFNIVIILSNRGNRDTWGVLLKRWRARWRCSPIEVFLPADTTTAVVIQGSYSLYAKNAHLIETEWKTLYTEKAKGLKK